MDANCDGLKITSSGIDGPVSHGRATDEVFIYGTHIRALIFQNSCRATEEMLHEQGLIDETVYQEEQREILASSRR